MAGTECAYKSVEEYMKRIMEMVDMTDMDSIPFYQISFQPTKWRMYANGDIEAKNEADRLYACEISKIADWLLKWGDKLSSCQDAKEGSIKRIISWIKDFLFVLIITSNECPMSDIFFYTYFRLSGSIFSNTFYWLLPYEMSTEMIKLPSQMRDVYTFVIENLLYKLN